MSAAIPWGSDPGATMPPTAIDPVCGMNVDPQAAPAQTTHQGVAYYFCCTHCLHKFTGDPDKYLHSKPEPMALQLAPPPPAGPGTKRQYICPMDPEVISDRPGPCPKCGMALEPKDIPTEDEADPEQAKMVRLFWIALAASVPVFILHMGTMLIGDMVPITVNIWIQAILTTVVVLGCGATFYQRAWTALRHGAFNMFTLIVLGVTAAYLYSVVMLLWSSHGHHDLYFESAAAIIGPGARRPCTSGDHGGRAPAGRVGAEVGAARWARWPRAGFAARTD
jgi:P-type Cu+ transporter